MTVTVLTEAVVKVVVAASTQELDKEVEVTENNERRWQHRLRLKLQNEAVALELPHL